MANERLTVEQFRARQTKQYQSAVSAAIYPQLGRVPINGEVDSSLSALEAVAESGPGETMHDYENYNAFGWNPEVQQVVRFILDKNTSSRMNREQKAEFLLTLGEADSPNTGPIFKRDFESNENVLDGRWKLVPATEEAHIHRKFNHAFVEIDGVREEIPYDKSFNDGQGGHYTFAKLVGGGGFDMTRLAVEIEPEEVLHTGKVLRLGKKIYAYERYLGALELTDNDGNTTITHLCNVKQETIEKSRKNYTRGVKLNVGKTGSARRYYGKPQEAMLVNPNDIPNESHRLFVEVTSVLKKDDEESQDSK